MRDAAHARIPYLAFARAVALFADPLAPGARRASARAASSDGVELGAGRVASVRSRSSARARASARARSSIRTSRSGAGPRSATTASSTRASRSASASASAIASSCRTAPSSAATASASRAGRTARTTRFRRSAASSSKTTSRSARTRRSIGRRSARRASAPGTKIDNLVQIAHGVTIGRNVAARRAGRHRRQHDDRGRRDARRPGRRGRAHHARQGRRSPRRRPAFRTRSTPGRSSPAIRRSPTATGSRRRRCSGKLPELREARGRPRAPNRRARGDAHEAASA